MEGRWCYPRECCRHESIGTSACVPCRQGLRAGLQQINSLSACFSFFCPWCFWQCCQGRRKRSVAYHMVSPISLAEGATIVSRVCPVGNVTLMQHPSDSLSHLLTHVLMRTPQHAGGFSAGPPAHRQFAPDGSGMVAPSVVPLFPTSASSVVSTRDDLFGNTHSGDPSACSSVTHSSVAARRSALPPVSLDDRVSVWGSNRSAVRPLVSLDGVSSVPDLGYCRRGVSRTRHTFLLQRCLSQHG